MRKRIFTLLLSSLAIGAWAQDEALRIGTFEWPRFSSNIGVAPNSLGQPVFANDKTVFVYRPAQRRIDTLYRYTNPNIARLAGLAVINDSTIAISANDSVFAVNTRTRVRTHLFRGFSYPTNLLYRPADSSIYMMETGGDNGRGASIARIDLRTGQREFLAGQESSPQNQLGYVNDTAAKARFGFPRPNGPYRNRGALAWNRTGDTLLIADPNNRAIRWMALGSRVVGTYAGPLPGVGTAVRFKDSTRYEARFNELEWMTTDDRGFIYIADGGPFNDFPSNGNRIRKIDTLGNVYTLAGNGIGQGSGQFNNIDFVPGVGASAQMGNPRLLMYDNRTDTMFFWSEQRFGTLSKRTQQVTQVNYIDRRVGEGDIKLLTTSNSNLPLTLTLVSAPANVTLRNDTISVPANAAVGLVRIALSNKGNEDSWLAYSDTAEFRIKRDQGVSIRKVADKIFGQPAFRVRDSITVATGNALSFAVVSQSPAGVVTFDQATTEFTITGTGTVIFQATHPGTDTLMPIALRDTFVVGKADQIIAFAALPDRTFGDAPFVLSSNVNSSVTGQASGLNVAFALVSTPSSVATLNPSTRTITIVGAGVVTVRATQAGNANFNAAQPVDQIFTINRRAQVLTFDTIPDLPKGHGNYTLQARSAAPNSNLPLTFRIIQAPTNVSLLTNPARVAIPATADTGLVILEVRQAGNNNHLPDSTRRQFRIIDPTGLKSWQLAGTLRLYPNPASDIVRLEVPEAWQGQTLSLEVLDARGVRVYQQTTRVENAESLAVPVQNWAPGMYMLRLRQGEQYRLGRLTKE